MDKPTRKIKQSTDQQLARRVDLAYNTAEGLVKRNASQLQSIQLLNLIGYGFLLFTLFDFIAAIVPANFTNAVWELGLVGDLVERVAAPLIGFGFVFLGGALHRSPQERFCLKILSWSALGFALLYILLLLLSISSTFRIDRKNNQKITLQAQQRQSQLQQVREEFKSIDTVEKMEAFLGRMHSQGQTPKIENGRQYQTTQKELTEFLDNGERRLNNQIQSTRYAQRQRLLEKFLKWSLGALLSTFLFIAIWRGTAEIRHE